jgi:hypothetical protein
VLHRKSSNLIIPSLGIIFSRVHLWEEALEDI